MLRAAVSYVLVPFVVIAAAGCVDERADRNATCTLEAMYSSSVNNKAEFVRGADNVFVGVVRSDNGLHIDDDHTPHSQFNVDVIENIKGELPNSVIVSQIGGVVNSVLCLQNNDPLLSENGVYIFTTKLAPKLGIHFILAAGYGDIKLSAADALAITEGKPAPTALTEMRRAVADAAK